MNRQVKLRRRNMWAALVLGAALAAGFVFPGSGEPAYATSLWGGESLFTDQKARRVGDLVTLIIVEQTEAAHSASTETGKSAEVSIGPWGGIADGFPTFSARGSDDLSAGGTTRRGGSIRGRLTARVIEVLPNGVLRIEGRQGIVVNDEEQELVVSGLVRERDIAPDNTVLSTYVADAQITFKGSGAIGNKQTPGILTSIFRFLF